MRIKILHLIESLSCGGAEKRLVHDLQNIDRDNFYHIVCCLFEGNELQNEITKLGIRVYGLRLKHLYEFYNALLGLWQIVRQEKPDIIHTQLFAADIYGRIIGKLFKIPVVSTIQSSVYEPGIEFFWSPKRKFLDSISGRLCNTKFIAVSNFVKTSVIKRLHFRRDDIDIIYNYISTNEVSHYGNRHIFRNNLGLSQSDIILITVGKLNPPKGHRYLLEAMLEVISQYPSAKLLIVGDGPCKDELLKIKDNSGLGSQVSFLGERTDVSELLFLSDIFVFSSLSEGLPLSLLEAMAMEKPCIAFDLGPMSEVIENNISGILVAPKDIDALSEAIINLIKDPQRAIRLGQAARERVLHRFTTGEKVEILEKIYKAMYKKRRT